MTFVVTDACIRCKYMDCVMVCPVDCFHEGESMLVIDPEGCIDCGACWRACPVAAIEGDYEPAAEPWLELNRHYAGIWPVVVWKPLNAGTDAEAFKDAKGKFEKYFSPAAGPGIRGRVHAEKLGADTSTGSL